MQKRLLQDFCLPFCMEVFPDSCWAHEYSGFVSIVTSSITFYFLVQRILISCASVSGFICIPGTCGVPFFAVIHCYMTSWVVYVVIHRSHFRNLVSTALKNKCIRKNVRLPCSSLHIGDKFNNIDLFNSEGVFLFLILFVWWSFYFFCPHSA